MHMRTGGHQTMVTETSKTINFWDHFVYNTSNPIHQYNVFLLASFLEAG